MKRLTLLFLSGFFFLNVFSQWDVTEILNGFAQNNNGRYELYDVILGDGRNDGVNRLYITTRSGSIADGDVYEASFNGTSWSVTSTLNSSLNNLPIVAVGEGRNDGVSRVYVCEWAGAGSRVFEYTWNGTGWDELAIGAQTYGMLGITVDDARGDNIQRVYVTGINVHREFTWNGSSFDVVDISTTQGSEGMPWIGDGRGDGTTHYYAPGQSSKEFTWNGTNWAETSTITPTGSWPETIIFANGRNDGVTRGYMQDYTATFEITWNGSAWVNTQINPRVGRGELWGAVTKSDKQTYIYSIDCGDGLPLMEYTYNSGSGNYDTYTIDAATGATGSIDFGPGRNDDTVRIYATDYAGGRVWEITNTSPRVLGPKLRWSNLSFTEAIANDGTVTGTGNLVLEEDTFTLSTGTFTATTHYTVSGLPANLSAVITLTGKNTATIALSGSATAHEDANDVAGFTITFEDAAFESGDAAEVKEYTRGDLSIDFNDAAAMVLTYDATTFDEATANDGSISNTIGLTLTNETFTKTSGNFSPGSDYSVSNLPAGLSLSIAANSATTATISISGKASANADADDISNLTIVFQDAAFTGGNAANVVNYDKADLAIDFDDQPVLTWTGAGFNEAGANNGSVSGSITISLSGETFALASGSLSEGTHFTSNNVPAGLSTDIAMTNNTEAVLTLTGNADSHMDANDIGNLTITFNDAAFTNVAAVDITNTNKSDITVDFDDPPVTPFLSWSDTSFTEALANNGSIGNQLVLTLYNETFTAASGDLTESTDYTITNLPTGLLAILTLTSDTSVQVVLAGNAAAHENSDDVANLGIAFLDAVFTGGNAANVSNYEKTQLTIDFENAQAPELTWSSTVFAESSSDDGSISNAITISLANETFAISTGSMVESTHYNVNNLPMGLSITITVNSANSATASLTGNALFHEDADDISDLQIDFINGAFTNGNASGVTNASQTLSIDFDPVTSSVEPNAFTFKVYPNPAHNHINFNLGDLKYAQIGLINVNGQVVKSCTILSGSGQLDINGLNPGLYLLQIDTEGHREMKKLIIQ